MTTHEHLAEQEEVMAYLDGELPVDQAAKAAAHLQECRQCQQFAVGLRSVSQAMTQWEIEPFDRELDTRLTEALEERKEQSAGDVRPSRWRHVSRVNRWRRWGWMTGAAGVAVLAVVAVMPHTGPMPPSSQTTIAEREQNRQFAASSPAATRRLTPDELRRREESELASSLQNNRSNSIGVTASLSSAPKTTTAGQNSSPVSNAPMIARTAELTITTKDFEAARTRIDEILKRESGYIGEMNVSSPADTERKLTAVLRVPADRLEVAIAELKKVGRVESESQAGEEVTSQYVDLQARLSNARNTEQRLTELLRTRTGKLEEVVAVEEKLSEVREQIERMEAEKKALTKRVDFGTVDLSLAEEHQCSDADGSAVRRHAIPQCRRRGLPQCCGQRDQRASVPHVLGPKPVVVGSNPVLPGALYLPSYLANSAHAGRGISG